MLDICKGRVVSSNLPLVKGGGEEQISFGESGTYPLADLKGSSILVLDDVRGFCGHDGNDLVLARTFKSVYAPSYVLTCNGGSSIDISGPAETRPTGLFEMAHLASAKTQFRRTCVCLQTFTIGQLGGNFAQHLRALLTDLNNAAAFLKVVHPQRA